MFSAVKMYATRRSIIKKGRIIFKLDESAFFISEITKAGAMIFHELSSWRDEELFLASSINWFFDSSGIFLSKDCLRASESFDSSAELFALALKLVSLKIVSNSEDIEKIDTPSARAIEVMRPAKFFSPSP